MGIFFHSVTLDESKCVGCTNCIKRCPTEAIRVRSGKAVIMSERCIDCGECIRICPHHAKRAKHDHLSMLEKFRGMGARKFYMIFSLTDETYALLSSARAPAGVEEHDYYFAVAMLDHSYWILGSVLGSVLGAALGLDTTGVDFAMTALFLVIAVGQWKKAGSHLPALLGGAATLLSLMLVGAEEMLLPALGMIVLALTALRPKLDDCCEEKKEEVPCS